MPDAALFDPSRTHRRRLDNGLTVIVREDRSAPVVAIVTHVCAGYFDEPDGRVGIAHVLEHMYFKGTPTRGPGAIARATKAAGGYLNAGTIYDRTSYYTVLPAASVAAGLEIQADAFANSVIDEAELAKELQVIIQEAKRKLDNPAAVAQETLFELLFDRHRMRRWRIGTEAELAGYTRADVLDFYRAHYRASNTVLVIVGDVDVADVFRLVDRHYGGLDSGAAPRDRGAAEPERRELRLREMDGDIVQTHVEIGWRVPGTLHDDTPALDMLAMVLGQGRASRLYTGVRDAGVANAVSAYNYTPTELGVFGISAELAPANARRALVAIARAVDALRSRRLAETELQRARNIMEARLIRRFETMEAQANVLADWQALGDWRLGEEYVARVLAVTTDDLRDVAQRYLDFEAAGVLVYRPRPAAPLDATGEQILLEAAGTTGTAANSTATAAAAPGRRTTAARHAAAPELTHEQGGVRIYTAANGMRIVVKPRRNVPLVSFAVVCRGASLLETQAEAGVTMLLARGSIRGTRTRTGPQLAAQTESLGGAITPSAGADLLEWDLSVPSRHFESALDLLAEAVIEPTFPEGEIERERRFALEDVEQLRDDMYRFPMRLFMQAAFADHPYGYPLGATERAIASLDRSQIADWHAHEVLRGEPWVFVVGDVDADHAARSLAARFAALEAEPRERRVDAPVWPRAPVLEVELRDKAQTALVVGFPGPARASADVYPLQLFANVISGLGGRLFEELRSRRALAYSVAAFPLVRWQAGAFVGYIATSPEREDEARERMIEELRRSIAEPLPESELERARRYTIGTWRIRSQTNAAHLTELITALLLGNGLDEIREYEQRIEAITPEIVQQTAQRYIDADRAVVGVVRGTGKAR
jgi:zinc protease